MLQDVLKETRLSLNLKQADVAEYVGITTQTYMKWENGKNEPKASHVKKLAEILNISEMEICRGELSNKISLDRFIVQRSKINLNPSLETLIVWELLPDHNEYFKKLVDDDISQEKEDLIDALS
nr:helix-turn-helix transcriptional regulator [Moritella viscosa]